MADSRIEEFKKTIASFQNNSDIDFSAFDYLVTPVGFSWEPSLCFIQAIKPKEVLFVVTEETEGQLDEMFDAMREWSLYTLPPSAFSRAEVKGTNTAETYQAIKNFCKNKDTTRILFDATAGKKSMTSAITLAAESDQV